jgi:uncharacterized protein (TIGR02722 family)
MIKRLSVVSIALLISCAPSVTRVDPSQPIDLSGRWNDSDSRLVADQMIQELLGSPRFQEYVKEKGRKPAIMVGLVRNKTSEHIDAANYIKKIELAIFNSALADVVENAEFRDKLRLERVQQQEFSDPTRMAAWGKEIGADLMLFGEMTSETDTNRNQRIVNYVTTLFLTDMETNKRVWYGQKEIKKVVRK